MPDPAPAPTPAPPGVITTGVALQKVETVGGELRLQGTLDLSGIVVGTDTHLIGPATMRKTAYRSIREAKAMLIGRWGGPDGSPREITIISEGIDYVGEGIQVQDRDGSSKAAICGGFGNDVVVRGGSAFGFNVGIRGEAYYYHIENFTVGPGWSNHGIYISQGCYRVTLRSCNIHGLPNDDGHFFKSRAGETEVYDLWCADEGDNAVTAAIDACEGGQLTVEGLHLVRDGTGVHNAIIRYGQERDKRIREVARLTALEPSVARDARLDAIDLSPGHISLANISCDYTGARPRALEIAALYPPETLEIEGHVIDMTTLGRDRDGRLIVPDGFVKWHEIGSVIISVPPAPQPIPAPELPAMTDSTWTEWTTSLDGTVPDTKQQRGFLPQSAFQKTWKYPNGYWGNGGQHDIQRSWGAGSLMYVNGEPHLVAWGGGGGSPNYLGNDVSGINLLTRKWVRFTLPSEYMGVDATTGRPIGLTVDNTPSSSHSYNSLEWLPDAGKLFHFGGAIWNHEDDKFAWMFDPATATWAMGAPSPFWNDSLVPNLVYDEATQRVIVAINNRHQSYHWPTDTWVSMFSWAGFKRGTGAINPLTRDIFYITEGTLVGGVIQPNVLTRYNCSAPANRPAIVTPTGDLGWTAASVKIPGIAWDAVHSDFLIWGGTGSVWSLDPTTLVSTLLPVAAGPTPPPAGTGAQSMNGVFSRWRRNPATGTFVGVNGTWSNVWEFTRAA